MSQRLRNIIQQNRQNGKKMLSLYLTAGFPKFEMTGKIIRACANAQVDFIELGMPFSDPIADGPTIQKAADRALQQGVSISKILELVAQVRQQTEIPIILMGYLNPVFQFGFQKFFEACAKVGVDGLILPDWPLEESESYLPLLNSLDLDLIYLIAPNTPKERIQKIDTLSRAFVYCTAYTGVTGKDNRPSPETERFLQDLNRTLQNPFFIGFGVKTQKDFEFYTQYASGVIVGSAFIKFLENLNESSLEQEVKRFVQNLRGVD